MEHEVQKLRNITAYTICISKEKKNKLFTFACMHGEKLRMIHIKLIT